jgi:hypothetical protein
VVSAAVIVLGLSTAATSSLRSMTMLVPLMVVAGSSWIVFISVLSALIQTLAPAWVRARVLAMFVLFFQGGLAIGSVLWGVLAARAGLDLTLLIAGLGTTTTAGLAFVLRLPSEPASLDPSNLWRLPAIHQAPQPDDGPVLVTIEYVVADKDVDEFLDALDQMERVRRRDGAFRWGVYRDTEADNHYVEAFLVDSWGEHLRQHERLTIDDQAIAEHVAALTSAPAVVRHFLVPRRDS